MRNVMHIFFPLAGSVGRTCMATAAMALTLALTGCATAPPPNDSMNLAQTELQAAREAGAADYAPVDLGFAQDKFQQAQAAMAERKYADAANLAGESSADADLARAKARLGAARAKIQSKVQENSHLRQLGEQPAAEAPSQPQALPTRPAAGEDMPAAASSTLSAPPGSGFQTVPDDNQQPASSSSIPGDQP
jgi:hypothetical protein